MNKSKVVGHINDGICSISSTYWLMSKKKSSPMSFRNSIVSDETLSTTCWTNYRERVKFDIHTRRIHTILSQVPWNAWTVQNYERWTSLAWQSCWTSCFYKAANRTLYKVGPVPHRTKCWWPWKSREWQHVGDHRHKNYSNRAGFVIHYREKEKRNVTLLCRIQQS